MARRTTIDGADRAAGLGRAGHATCGLVGLTLAGMALLATWPVVVAVATLLPLLSTTAIVLLGVFVWLGLWFVLDVAAGRWLGRRARRGRGDRERDRDRERERESRAGGA